MYSEGGPTPVAAEDGPSRMWTVGEWFRRVTARRAVAERRLLADGGRIVDSDDVYGRSFLEAADPLVVVEAESGVIVAVNDAAVDLLGRSRSSLVGAHQWELHPSSEREAYRKRFEEAVEEGGADIRAEADEPVFVDTGDGDEVPVDVHSTSVTVDGTEHLVASVREVTDRTARLRRLERQATAMDASLTGISILNADGEYVYMNRTHADIFGYDSEDLLGGTWRQLYDEERIEHIEDTVFPELAEAGAWEGELVGRRKDGEPAPQVVNLTALPDGGLVCVNRDISDRRRRERRLEAIRERVERFMLAETTTDVVEELIAATTAVVERPLAGYWSYEDGTDRLVPVDVSAAAAESDLSISAFERGSGLVWRAFEASETRYYADLPSESDVYEPETPLRSEMIVPIGTHGVLFVGSTTVDDFSSSERELLGILGRHATTALTLLERERELKAARDAREAERRQLRDVIDHIPHLVFAKNADGEFVLANQAVAEAYGTTVSELEGRTDASFATEADEIDHFEADDRRVLESDEAVHRPEETLTDADGNERTLRTWKVPFTPAGSDERAVLGVATDITDYKETELALERQRKLAALNRIGRLLLESETPREVCTVGAEAAAEALDAAGVAVYAFDEDDGTLRPAGVAGEATTAAPADLSALTPDDTHLWDAFSHRRTKRIETDDDRLGTRDAGNRRGQVAVPLDAFGLLLVETGESAGVDVEFIETAGRNLTAALQRAAQEAQVEELNERLKTKNAKLTEQQRLGTGFREAQRRLRRAKSRSAVYETLVDFALRAGDDAWIGRWSASDHVVRPVFEATESSPATEQGGTEDESPSVSPALTAAIDGTAEVVTNTRLDASYERWSSRLLQFGYRSAVAVPISHNGVIRGTVEVLSKTSDAFDRETVAYLTEAATSAGVVLERLDRDPNRVTRAEAEFEWPADGVLFPDVPERVRFTASSVVVSSEDTATVTGTVRAPDRAAVERYFETTPRFARPSITALEAGAFSFGVDRVAAPDDDLRRLWDTLKTHDAELTSATSDVDGEVITAHVGAGRTRPLWEDLKSIGRPRLVAKRRIEDEQSEAEPLATLTDRQTEVLTEAYRRGFFDQPKGVTGDELAERFDISRSTLHQHLRTAERKLLGTLLDRSDDAD